MNINDCVPGTAYIALAREDFKNKERFDSLLEFLKLPQDKECIKINVFPSVIVRTDTGHVEFTNNFS